MAILRVVTATNNPGSPALSTRKSLVQPLDDPGTTTMINNSPKFSKNSQDTPPTRRISLSLRSMVQQSPTPQSPLTHHVAEGTTVDRISHSSTNNKNGSPIHRHDKSPHRSALFHRSRNAPGWMTMDFENLDDGNDDNESTDGKESQPTDNHQDQNHHYYTEQGPQFDLALEAAMVPSKHELHYMTTSTTPHTQPKSKRRVGQPHQSATDHDESQRSIAMLPPRSPCVPTKIFPGRSKSVSAKPTKTAAAAAATTIESTSLSPQKQTMQAHASPATPPPSSSSWTRRSLRTIMNPTKHEEQTAVPCSPGRLSEVRPPKSSPSSSIEPHQRRPRPASSSSSSPAATASPRTSRSCSIPAAIPSSIPYPPLLKNTKAQRPPRPSTVVRDEFNDDPDSPIVGTMALNDTGETNKATKPALRRRSRPTKKEPNPECNQDGDPQQKDDEEQDAASVGSRRILRSRSFPRQLRASTTTTTTTTPVTISEPTKEHAERQREDERHTRRTRSSSVHSTKSTASSSRMPLQQRSQSPSRQLLHKTRSRSQPRSAAKRAHANKSVSTATSGSDRTLPPQPSSPTPTTGDRGVQRSRSSSMLSDLARRRQRSQSPGGLRGKVQARLRSPQTLEVAPPNGSLPLRERLMKSFPSGMMPRDNDDRIRKTTTTTTTTTQPTSTNKKPSMLHRARLMG